MKLIYISILLITTIFSQHDHHDGHDHMHGKIFGLLLNDATGVPVDYATVAIFKADTNLLMMDSSPITGTVSNEDGYFNIVDIEPGKYKIIIKFTGYETIELDDMKLIPPSMKIDLGTIRLFPKNLELEEITVEEKKTFIKNEIDKKVYNIADEASTTGGSASDVLEQIPSVTIDMDGNIQLRQNGNVTILINGRESNFGNNVDMLGADMIERIEVITTPSAKYDPDGTAGIINIILSKNEYVGTSGNMKYHYGQRENYGLSGSLNFLKNDWNIFANYNVNNKTRIGSGYRNTLYYDENNNFIENGKYSSSVMNSTTFMYPENMNLKLGVENYPSDHETVAFDITFIQHEGIDKGNVYLDYYDEFKEDFNYLTTVEENGNDITFGFGYFNDLAENEQLSFQFDFDDHDDYEISQYEDVIKDTDDKGSDRIFMLDYNRPIKNIHNAEGSKIEVGIKINSNNDRKNQKYNDIPFNYNYDQDRLSAYINASYYFTESFGIQGGLRFEASKTNSLFNTFGLDLSNPDSADNLFEWALAELGENLLDYEYNYDRVYPSLYFLYNMKEKGDLKFEFGRRVNRPSEWSTNPFPDVSDPTLIHQGNPHLRPEDIYKGEFSYSNRLPIGYLSVGVYLSRTTDLIDRYKYSKVRLLPEDEQFCTDENFSTSTLCAEGESQWIVDEIKDILTWVNKGKTEDSGFEIMLMTRPLPMWSLMISGNFWYNNTVEAEDENMLGVESGFYGYTKSTFKLKDDQEIQLSGHFSTKMKITTGEISPMQSMDFAYKKEVDDRFNITLKVKDIFNSRGFHIITDKNIDDDDTVTQFMEADFRRNKRTISLSFEYKFGEFKKKKYIREDSHSHDHGDGDGMSAGY